MKRKTVLWLILMACFSAFFILMLAYSSTRRSEQYVGYVDIRIERDGVLYLQEQDVRSWLKQHGIRLENRSFDEFDVSNVEHVLRQNPYVASVQVYPVGDTVLSVAMKQRNPVLKVYSSGHAMFQIDENGVEMPVNPKYTARLRVLTGNLPYAPDYGFDLKRLSDTSEQVMLRTAFELNEYLLADPLWDAMFEQIYLTKDNEFELIPKVGGQLVRLGRLKGLADLEDKMRRLRLFYQYGMGDDGWEKYSVLDLRYEDQLVATRRRGFSR